MVEQTGDIAGIAIFISAWESKNEERVTVEVHSAV